MRKPAAKIAVTISADLLKRLDSFVKSKVFKSRSQAVQIAVEEVVERMEHKRLEHECEKLDPRYEQTLADEGLTEDDEEWPNY